MADLIFIMLISEVVGDIMRASDDSLWGALIGAGTIMIMNKVLKWWAYKSDKFSNFMEGSPVILIRHGSLNKKEMDRNKITIEDLEQAGREKGVGDISTIALAILEVDGKLNILSDENIKSKNKNRQQYAAVFILD